MVIQYNDQIKAVHDDELVVMGGCDDDGVDETKCHGLTEIFDPEDGWTSHAVSNFPVQPGILTGHALVSDPAGIIIITDSSQYDNTVYRLDFLRNDLFRWDTLGKLQEPAFYLSGQVSKSGN